MPEALREVADHEREIIPLTEAPGNRLSVLGKALRVHQWVKNLLVFIPLLMAHRVADGTALIQAALAFLAWCFCASGVYLINDLLDVDTDRLHPYKRKRPFAAGKLSKKWMASLTPALLLPGLAIGLLLLPAGFALMLAVYVTLNAAYTLYLKRLIVIDVLVLAGFYTLRVLSGGFATSIEVSPWLLAFSMFLFLSLAFVKRFTELRALQSSGNLNSAGRGYTFHDIELLKTFGTVSGYLSVLVLPLYINSSHEVRTLYDRPALLWLVGPCLLYWITRVWFLASRGKLHDDPVVFMVKDPVSYLLGVIVAAILIGASL